MNIPFSKLIAHPLFSGLLQADEQLDNYPRQVMHAHFSWVNPVQPADPEMLHFSSELLHDLQLTVEDERVFLAYMSGQQSFPQFKPFAMCYGGHQFGHWAGQLGDGRAIHILEANLANQPWAFQLKGAGPTPYSRLADGYAVLRSSIREYLCSEAMHHLGVPTTRALSLVKSGDWVERDVLYNGNRKNEPGAIVCRVAPSFIRFGNFEIFAARQEISELKELVDFTLHHYFPHLGAPSKQTYLHFFQEVVSRTLTLVIHWQRVGFVHGVLNTDNMSIHGLTIDFGPYGWLDDFDPTWTPNTTDREHRRYRFENQPNIALWNLIQLANALYPLLEDAKPLEDILLSFNKNYSLGYHQMMCEKLGLRQFETVSDQFVTDLTELMTQSQMDMTLFYRELSGLKTFDMENILSILQPSSYLDASQLEDTIDPWKKWFAQLEKYVNEENWHAQDREKSMKLTNPKYVLRNYMAQMAIEEAENGNYALVSELYQLMLKPYEEQPAMEKWYAKRPEWAKNKVGSSTLSCSS